MSGARERGSTLIGSIGGVAVFLAFLLFAVQLLANLYATSTLTSAAHEAARSVAGRSVDHDDPSAIYAAQARAGDQLRSRLGRSGHEALLDWSDSTADDVVLRASAARPTILPSSIPAGFGDRIERTVQVRRERWR